MMPSSSFGPSLLCPVVESAQISWISPLSASLIFLDLALVIGPTGICNGSFNSACWFSSFVPKCYTALIFALKRPCGHWMYCIWTKTQYLNVSTQKYRITVPKVSLDLVYTITLLFTQNFCLTRFDFKISYLGSNPYPRLVLVPKWNFCFDLKHKIVLVFWETKRPIFVRKCYTTLNFAPKGPYGHRKDYIWTKTQCLNVLIQKYHITVSKVSVDFVYTIPLLFTQNFFLTCFDFKISHLVQMITLDLFWTQNEILVWIWIIILSLHFGKPKVPIFVPKCYTAFILSPKGRYGHWKDCCWTQKQCFNVLV